jgi:hypothetical protein
MSTCGGFVRMTARLMSVLFVLSVAAAAQSTATAELRGVVRDQQGAVIAGATISLRDESRGLTRSTSSNAAGEYVLLLVPPGTYTLTVEAGGFAPLINRNLTLTVGQSAELPVSMQLAAAVERVDVVADAELVETSRTAVSSTVEQKQIQSLPINERNYLGFSLTTSMVNRDNGRPIGPAPTSGLNIGGQRGRSTLVQVDGADNTDMSVNAARSTLSQEAVQEFQIVTNSYAAEFGRASGGVVNVVSKSGNNDLHGNIFGFLRHKSFQADNALSPEPNPPYTRSQIGATLGGPIVRNRTFFFAAWERRQRRESGFFTSDVAQGLGSSVTIGAPFLPFTQTFAHITSGQAAFINGSLAQAAQLIGGGQVAQGQALAGMAIQYAYLASSGGHTALNGTNPLLSPGGTVPIPAGQPIGQRFFLTGAPVPVSDIAFRPLNNLQRVFPVKDNTSFSSLRLDHELSQNHRLTLRGGYNPSRITGIQVESQNQALGQNDFSRTGIQVLHDTSAVAVLNSTLSPRTVNEFRFSFGQRVAEFKSQNGEAVAHNIAGTAFIGRELFSPVQRTEKRYQLTDSVSMVRGSHNPKFGVDINFLKVDALFELNFAGLFNFGGLTAPTLGFPLGTPDFTPVQQYGIGFPANFIQGFGNPRSALSNKPLAFYAQDSWRIRPNLTLNYGVRYDLALTQQIAPTAFTDPLTGITLSVEALRAAQDAINGQQGFPRDKNNVAPRIALAWDPRSDGQTVIRAAYGIFYDQPLQAVAFNSDIADASQQQQFVATPGSPSPTATLNAVQIFQGTVVPGLTPGVAATAQYQTGRQRFNDQTFPGFGPVLPFILPVAKNFQYASAHHANLTVEQQLTRDMSLSMSYLWVGGRHLPRPIDVNAPRNDLVLGNWTRYAGRPPLSTTEAVGFQLPSAGNVACPMGVPPTIQCFTNPIAGPNQGQIWGLLVPGMVAAPVSNLGSRVVTPAIANFFRPNAPNYLLAFAASGGLVSKAVLDSVLAGSLRTPGVLTPFGAVNAQSSNANSTYNALTVELKKRFSSNYQFLTSYTWSHAIDESSDLQTLLLPQDNYNLAAERSTSLFDQRHRFVFSSVITSPVGWRSQSGLMRVLADFTLAPIVELSSGRPFNILTGIDTNSDQSNQTDRPNVGPNGVLTLPGPFETGNLGRNAGITRNYAAVDLRVMRAVPLGERTRLDLIAEGFNLFNRFNQAGASPFFNDVNAWGVRRGNRYESRPTAAFDPRQFQFGLKLNW